MPRAFAAAFKVLPSLDAAVNRPSDQGSPISISWPRRFNSLMVLSETVLLKRLF